MTPPPINGIGAKRFPRTLEVIERGRKRGLHHGVQFCVRQGSEVLADLAAGESPDGRPFTPDTLMPWLSAGKPLLAFLLGWLEFDEGQLDLPIAQLPTREGSSYPSPLIPEFGRNGKEGITLRHLLTHTAGIEPVAIDWPKQSRLEILERIFDAPIRHGFRVGNDGAYDPARTWFVIGEILRRSFDCPVEQCVRQFERKLPDTWLAMTDEQFDKYEDRIGAVTARTPDGQMKLTPAHLREMCVSPHPGSSWRGPIHDLARFYRMMCTGQDDPWTKLMTTPQRVGVFDQTFQHIVDFGLGVIVNSNRYGVETVPYGFGRHASDRAFGHGGSQSCVGFADPEHNLAVAAVANGMPGDPQHNRRFRDLCSAIYEDLGLAGNG